MLDKLSNPYAYNHFYASNDIKAMSLTLDAELQDINSQLIDANLPIFTSKEGEWLDYIAWSLYGLKRPTIALESITSEQGGIGNSALIGGGFMMSVPRVLPESKTLDDDCFKRMLIWHTFVGDGWFFNIDFFKRKIKRFIQEDMHEIVDNAFDISINVEGTSGTPELGDFTAARTISIPTSEFAICFKYLYLSGFLSVPLGMEGFNVQLL